MRFNRFGGGDDDFGGGGRHNQQGFSDGLVEGLLVRRRIDRQNKFDRLNEQYAKKEMEMKESEERDRVLQAALQRRKMELDNEQSPEDFRTRIANREAETAGQVMRTQLAPKELAIHQQNANTSAANSGWGMSPSNPDNVYKKIQSEKGQLEIDSTKATDAWVKKETGDPTATTASYTLANKVKKDKATIEVQKSRVEAMKMKQAAMGIKDATKAAQADKAGYDKALDTLNGMKKAMDNDKNLVHSVEEINNQALFIANNWPDLVEAKINAPGTDEEEVLLLPKQKSAAGSAGSDPWAKYK